MLLCSHKRFATDSKHPNIRENATLDYNHPVCLSTFTAAPEHPNFFSKYTPEIKKIKRKNFKILLLLLCYCYSISVCLLLLQWSLSENQSIFPPILHFINCLLLQFYAKFRALRIADYYSLASLSCCKIYSEISEMLPQKNILQNSHWACSHAVQNFLCCQTKIAEVSTEISLLAHEKTKKKLLSKFCLSVPAKFCLSKPLKIPQSSAPSIFKNECVEEVFILIFLP